MVWAQWTLLGLYVLSAGISLGRHGTIRQSTYGVTDWLIAPAIGVWLLYEAGALSAIGF